MFKITIPQSMPKTIKFFRFLNILDDVKDELSPTKFNAWAANMTGVGASVATFWGFIVQHMGGIETVWGGALAYLTHAHYTRYQDKKQGNIQALKLQGIEPPQADQ